MGEGIDMCGCRCGMGFVVFGDRANTGPKPDFETLWRVQSPWTNETSAMVAKSQIGKLGSSEHCWILLVMWLSMICLLMWIEDVVHLEYLNMATKSQRAC